MAIFCNSGQWFTDVDGQERPSIDWAILQNGPIALFHKPAVLQETIVWLQQRGYVIAEADCSKAETGEDVLAVLCHALGFAPHSSLDGFNDYCWQVEVPDEAGFVLVLRHFNRVDRRLATDLLDILAGTSWSKLLLGQRFFTLVQTDDPKLDFPPLGGHAP